MKAFLLSDSKQEMPGIEYTCYFWNNNEHERAMAGIIAGKMRERGISDISCYEEDADKVDLIMKIIRTNFTLNANQPFMFANLYHNLKRAGKIPPKDSHKGLPAVIVSSGPSLEDDLEELKSWQGNCLMIASGSAVIRLDKAGITPTVTCLVDPFPKASAHFPKGDYTLLACYTADRVGAGNHSGNIAFMPIKRDLGWGIDLPGKPLESDLSVASYAFEYALYAGCNPIIFVGQDCGWIGEKSHSEGTCFDDKVGKQSFEMMADFFVTGIPRSGRTVYNCSKGRDIGGIREALTALRHLQRPIPSLMLVDSPVNIDIPHMKKLQREAHARWRQYYKSNYELFLNKQQAEPWGKYLWQNMEAYLYEAKAKREENYWPIAFGIWGNMVGLWGKLLDGFDDR